METNPNKVGSHLFLVRLWLNLAGADVGIGPGSASSERQDETVSGAWHGTVQHVLTGKSASFDDRTALADILLELMPGHMSNSETTPPEKGATP